ncbi:MAG: YdcF family protein [Negativicutes bacterium]
MEYLFIAKKIIQAFVMPPGLFVLTLIIVLINMRNVRGLVKTKWLLALTLILIYLLSIRPVENFLLRPLEYAQPFPQSVSGDVVVLLGGGSVADTPDFGGNGTLGLSSSARFITALRAQKQTNTYLLITSGSVLGVKSAECQAVKRYAIALGVPENKIIIDDTAKDTDDNAVNTIEICRDNGWRKLILVTSASHVPRSERLFSNAMKALEYDMKITCLPAGYLSPPRYQFVWADLLPGGMEYSVTALHEYLGLAAGVIGIK